MADRDDLQRAYNNVCSALAYLRDDDDYFYINRSLEAVRQDLAVVAFPPDGDGSSADTEARQ